jgi:hypothetical protein
MPALQRESTPVASPFLPRQRLAQTDALRPDQWQLARLQHPAGMAGPK